MTPSTTGPDRTILIVASTDDNLDTYQRLLQQDVGGSYRVLTEHYDGQILELCQSQPIDSILLDLHYPDTRCFEVLDQLKARIADRCPPVIVIDGSDAEMAVQSFKSGAVDYLVKDRLTSDALGQALRAAINASTADLLQPASQLASQLASRSASQSAAELQRLESAASFRMMANLVPDLLWCNDPQGVTLWYNQRWLDYTGQTFEQACGYGWLDAIHPDDRAQSLAKFQAAVDQGHSLQQEHRIRSVAGNYRWFLVRAEPQRDPHNHIMRWFGSATDIHDRRMAFAALQESEGRIRALVGNLPGGAVFVVDRDLRYLLAEGEALAVAGFRPEDLVGKTLFEALPSGLATSYESLYRQALAGAPFEHEHSVHDRSFISRGTPLRSSDGEVYAALAVSYDITDRKQAEQALRESEARLQAIANLVPDLLWDSEPDGSTNWYNQRWMEYTGQTFEQAIGWHWTDAIHPDDREESARRYREAVEQGMPLRQEHRIRRHDGAYRWFVVKASPLKDESGKVIKLYGAATDIHEQRVALDALRESEEKFRTLFDSIDEGLAITEIIYDDKGEIVDIIYRQVNRAYERHGHVYDVVGRSIFDVIPGVEDYWLDLYKRVARTGEPVREENYQQDVDRWFDVYFSRVDDNGRFVAIVFSDITDRKQREQQQAFLLKFSDTLRTEPNADAVANRAIQMLIEQLRLDRSYITTYYLEDNRADLNYQIGNDSVPPLPDHFVLSDFPEALKATFEGTLVIEDDWERQGLSEAEQRNSRNLGMRAMVAATLRKGENKPLWSMVAISSCPRRWTPAEIALVEEVAERTWVAIERAHAEAALRASEAKYRSLFDSMDEAYAVVEVIPDEAGKWSDFRFLEVNPAFMRHTGMEYPVGRTATQLLGAPNPRWAKIYGQVVETGEAIRVEEAEDTLNRVFDLNIFRLGDPDSRRVAVLFTDITDRKRTEAELAKSEEKYRLLFTSINEGYALCELLYDDKETPIDWKILQVNPAFETLTGFTNAAGKYGSELNQPLSTNWLQTLGTVAQTGEATRFEQYISRLDYWFEILVSRIDEDKHHIVVVFNNITHRKKAEERQAYLLSLSDAVRPLSDAVEIQATATRITMNFFEADRCYYCEIVDGNAIIRRDTSREALPSVAGVYPLSRFPIFSTVINTGHTFVVHNAHTTDLLDEALRELCLQLQVISFIDVPIIKEGRPVGILCITQGTPRHWTEFEIELAEEIAERTWAAVERARAEEAIAADLNCTQLLHDLATRLIPETDIQVLHNEIVTAAIELLEADAGTLQVFDETTQELVLLASQGLTETINKRFQRIDADSSTSCGVTLATGARAFVQFNVPESDDPDGSLRIHHMAGLLSAQSTPLITRSGKSIGMVSTHWRCYYRPTDRQLRFLDLLARQTADLIEQRQAEAERKHLLAREQAAREEAERANRIKDEFLSILSHELRAPLNPILGWSRLLQTKNLSQDKITQALTTIERNVRLQTQLVDDLLDVAKILRGKLSLNEVAVNLVPVIESALEIVKTAAEAKFITLHAELTDVGHIRGDTMRLQQIIWNLLSNAIKFTPAGGRVEICLQQVGGVGGVGGDGGDRGDREVVSSSPSPPSSPSSSSPSSYAQITVTDTGKGISREFLPHIFESFRQEDTSITRQYGGLGLGLAIVKYLVDAHSGTIVAASPGEGQGATFTVRFPLLRRNSMALPQELFSSASIDLTGVKVLAVDDSEDARELLATLLTQYGAETRVVASGEDVLVQLQFFKPTVLVCDIGMPEMDGYTLMQQVRSLRSRQGGRVPAIALTAYATEEDRQRALRCGFQKHMVKPLEPDALAIAIAELARQKLSQPYD